VYAGLKFSDFIGVELGTHMSKPSHLDNKKFKTHGTHLSVVGFIPLTPDPYLELVGSIGITHLKAALKEGHSLHFHKTLPRAMIGVQYTMLDHIAIRPSVTWEKTSGIKHEKINSRNTVQYGLGLQYKF